MPLLKSYEVARLEKALAGLLDGRGVLEWADSITAKLRRAAEDTEQCELPREWLARRRIVAVTDVKSEPRLTDWGRLLIDRGGFRVEIPRALDRQPLWRRFALAHEVGHTFFYDITEWPPRRRTFLSPGSKDLEWACDAIGARLLVPTLHLREEWDRHLPSQARRFSLASLKTSERRFRAPWRIVAQRLFDEGIWRGVLMQLRGYERAAASLGHRRKWNRDWFLEWYCASPELLDHLGMARVFLSASGKRRFHQLWGGVVELATRWTADATRTAHRSEYVPASCLRIGRLPKLLDEVYRSAEVQVIAAVKTFETGPVGGGKRRPSASIVMYLPLTVEGGAVKAEVAGTA